MLHLRPQCVNAADAAGRTPLHVACGEGRCDELTKALVLIAIHISAFGRERERERGKESKLKQRLLLIASPPTHTQHRSCQHPSCSLRRECFRSRQTTDDPPALGLCVQSSRRELGYEKDFFAWEWSICSYEEGVFFLGGE